MFGPGKYDHLCEQVRKAAGPIAEVVLIVVNGELGHGFSAQISPGSVVGIAAALRAVADQMERDWMALEAQSSRRGEADG